MSNWTGLYEWEDEGDTSLTISDECTECGARPYQRCSGARAHPVRLVVFPASAVTSYLGPCPNAENRL